MNDSTKKLLDIHSQVLERLGYEVLLSIALSEEPLTYSFVAADGEHQIEAIFGKSNTDSIEMTVALDSGYSARFKSHPYIKTITIQTTKRLHLGNDLEEITCLHAQKLKLMGFDVLYSIAQGKEPITYSFNLNKNEYQCEVSLHAKSENALEMAVTIDGHSDNGSEAETITLQVSS